MKNFPNGFTNWHETHFEVVKAIVVQLQKDDLTGKVQEVYESYGYGGIYELAEDLTDQFESLYEGKNWDGEYLDTIDQFLSEKLEA